jgi:hypothetical protein
MFRVGYAYKPDTINGTLILGGQPHECSDQWTVVDEVPYLYGRRWAFNIDM